MGVHAQIDAVRARKGLRARSSSFGREAAPARRHRGACAWLWAGAVAALVAVLLLGTAWTAGAQEGPPATTADLVAGKSGPATASPGDNVTYTLTISNNGPDAAVDARLTDAIPAGMTFVSVAGPAPWVCSPPPLVGDPVICTTALLAAGDSASFTLVANIPAGTAPGTVFTNVVTVSSSTFEGNEENNSAFVITQVPGATSADLSLTKTGPDTVQPGQNIVYTLTAHNFGPDTATSVTMSDPLPGGVTFVSMPTPAGWSCTTPAVGSGGTVTCTISSFVNGGNAVFTLTVNVPSGTPAGTTFDNVTQISSSTFDPLPENNSGVVSTLVLAASPDFAITKSHSGSAFQGQTGFTYTIGVSNVGTVASSGTVTVTDTLPPSMTATAFSGSGWSCSTGATPSCTRSDALAPGGSYPALTLIVNVANTAPTTVTNTATVANAGDTNPANDTAADTTTVNPGNPDLAIVKSHSGNAQQGQIGFPYTITVSNVGIGPTTGTVTVTDAVPTGMTATAMSGSGWSCTLATTTCTRSDALAAGAAYPGIILTVNVAASAPSSVTNTATVSTANDNNPANDTTTDPTTVGPAAPDLAIAKTHTGSAFQGQAGFAYTITVGNVGAAATSGLVTVTDTLPPSMTATAFSGAGWTCSIGATPSCTRSDALAAGSSYPVLTLTVNVAAGAPPSVTNTATVSNAGDANPGNDTASDPTNVTAGPVPDLTIAKTHSGNAQRGQGGFAYTITVSNVGSAATSGTVTVTDTLPASMTATAIGGAGWSCALGATPTCTRSDALAAGAAYPAITLTVSVAATAPSSVTNTATVSGGGDSNAANNTASDPTIVAGGPTASNFVFTILAGTSKSVDLTTGATGGPFTGATVVSVTPAGAGSVTVTPSGGSFILTFTPAPLFTGTVVITYTLSNSVATSAPATVTITVIPRRDPSKDPEVVGLINAQVAVSERFANAQMMNFNQRLESLHEDGYGNDQQGIGFASADGGSANAYVADGFADLPGASSYADATRPNSPSKKVFDQVFKAEPTAKKAPGAGGPRRDFSFWSSGYVNFGSSNDVIPGSGFDFTTTGVSVGADYRISPKLTAGVGLGYGRDRTRIGLNGTESRAETFSVTAYETYRPWRHIFLDGLLGFGTLKFDSQRFVTDSAAFAFGSRSGAEWFGSLSAGYEYRTRNLLLSPYGRIKAVWLTLDGFTESGDPTGSLIFGKQNVETYTGVLGLRGKYDIPTDFALLSPRFRLEYNHAFQNGGIAALAYADWIGGPTYFVPAIATTSDFATIGLGLDVKLPSATFVNFDYQTMINAFDTRTHMFQLKAGRKF